MTNEERRSRNRMIARLVGALFLLATATYMSGSILIDSMTGAPDYLLTVYANETRVIGGVLLQFVNVAAVAAIGVLLYPVLNRHSETVAVGYVVTRVVEATLLAVGGISTLLLVVLSQQAMGAGAADAAYFQSLGALFIAGGNTAYLAAMSALGLGSLAFCALLYRSRLVARWLALLGFIGYAALLGGSVLELYGIDMRMLHYAPGGLFELILPLWLFVKGFNPAAKVGERGETAAGDASGMGLSNASY